MLRVFLRVLVAVALLTGAAIVAVRFVDRDGDTREFRWLALGDSYSSGLGEIDRSADCARDVRASYVGRAADMLRADGYRAVPELAACAGATLDDMFAPQSTNTSPQLDFVDSTVDVVTFSLGGGDLGFGSVISECVVRNVTGLLSSAQGSVDSTIDRTCVIDPDHPANRGNGDDGWAGVEDELVAVIDAVLDKMSPQGTIFVLSYPLMFADPDSWPGAGCFGFSADNARSFNLGVIRMGAAVEHAVLRTAGAMERVRFVDWREQTSEREVWARHGLCGDEVAWVHGIRLLEPGGLTTSRANSFHPTAAGYAHVAKLLASAIADALSTS